MEVLFALFVALTEEQKITKETYAAVTRFKNLYYLYDHDKINHLIVDFLKNQIEQHPNIVELHRMYQNMVEEAGERIEKQL